MGDPGVGKGNVAKGADVCVPFRSLGVSLGKKTNVDKKINYKLTLLFWTMTKSRPRKTTYFHGASGAIIVGDLNKKGCINKMRDWAETILDYVGKIPIFFIGTKNKPKPVKNLKLLAELANEYNSHHFILPRSKEEALNPILKSITRHLGRNYSKLIKKQLQTVD